ncbi:cell fate regulator YaaT (PSP1 superfamily) [Geothermobacter ehrlichii]|uniref:Cell fate regulator YaaT (PSP1 superfamily) n=1 Tax=Geothermobacter ehrlichii TaxID=213224 RepID=A0A5D3WMP2_9BACT|nr:stage 0 sporulation family protein [Geothermobacter ehrlichii]TYP00121.1 cell fate regulator YaaT (PSP1 superfamily) [Geothermobacter ehrlichii]
MRVVTIKFRPAGKRYDFNAQQFELAVGDRVVVETDRGRALGTVVLPVREVEESESPKELKNIIRLATEEDLKMAEVNAAREDEAYRFCLRRIEERQMPMKLVKAEYQFDGSKIIFFFTADGRVDFRELVKDLAHHFHTRIEMRQIGVRDEAKLVGGLGVCGRELCCCTFLTEFAPVSVKMAKEQGLALNPNKISGQCGRLLCCLSYEFETYCEHRKGLPKCGKKIEFNGQRVQVIDVNILRREMTLAMPDGQRIKLTAEQFEKGEITAPQPQAAQTREQAPESAPSPGETSRKQPEETDGGDKPKRRRRPRKRKKKTDGGDPPETQAKQAAPRQPQTPESDESRNTVRSEGDNKKKPRRRSRRRRRQPKASE